MARMVACLVAPMTPETISEAIDVASFPRLRELVDGLRGRRLGSGARRTLAELAGGDAKAT